jgi:hypothetical protein
MSFPGAPGSASEVTGESHLRQRRSRVVEGLMHGRFLVGRRLGAPARGEGDTLLPEVVPLHTPLGPNRGTIRPWSLPLH